MSAVVARELTLPCGAVLPNRIAKAGMSEQLADRRGRPTVALSAVYRRWAAGGAGLLITGNVVVDHSQLVEPYNVVVADDANLAELSRWAAAARSRGAHAWLQLNHPGRQALRVVTRHPVAPSAVRPGHRGVFAMPRALRSDEILRLIDRFGTAARVAERAGFTGVQIHAAHGYLVSQFLSPLTNLRDDEWGGPLEHRMRFLLELIRAVRARVGSGFGVGVKLNSADFRRGGFTEDESVAVVAALGDEHVDLLEVTGGTFEATAMFGDLAHRAGTAAREAFFVGFVREVRGIARMPIMLTGGVRDPAAMARLIRDDEVQVIGMARPLAVMPDLPAAVLAGSTVPALPHPRRTGRRRADVAIESYWHNQQIRRMSRGRDPDPRRGLVRTVLSAGTTNLRWLSRRERCGPR